jgi:heat shock protein HslJ
LFKGNGGKFSPNEFLTRAQTLAVLSRINGANLAEGNPRRKGYYDLALQKGRYQQPNEHQMDEKITKEQFINILHTFTTIEYPAFFQPLVSTGTQPTTPTSASPLANTTWTLEKVDEKAISGTYTLTFNDTMINTKFCNGIGGAYSVSGNTIQGEFVQTKMFCLDEEEKNTLEQLFNLSGATFLITSTGENGLKQLTLTTAQQHTFTYLQNVQTIGGQKDEHGCYLGAGYRRNEEAQECQRPWEQPTTSGTATSPLDNTQRKLESFNGKSLTGTYFLSFQQGQLSTKFCNNIQGSYTLSGETINGTLISTLMACFAEEPTMLENGFSIDTGNLIVHNDTLTLTTHENVYIWKATPALE